MITNGGKFTTELPRPQFAVNCEKYTAVHYVINLTHKDNPSTYVKPKAESSWDRRKHCFRTEKFAHTREEKLFFSQLNAHLLVQILTSII